MIDQPALRRTLSHAGRSVSWAVFAAAASLAACDKSDKSNAYVPPPPPEVIVAPPVQRDVVTYLTFTGTVTASETVDLRARVQGFLEKMEFQSGQRVKKGELLFVIDKRQYQAAVDRTAAEVEARTAALTGAENDAKLARELADQHAGPEIDAIIKLAKKDAIKGELAAAKAQLADAKLNLDYCEVRAPIDGRISVNYVDVGNLVGRSEPTLLAEIVKSSPAYVSIDASESDVLAVRRGKVGYGGDGGNGSAKEKPGRVAGEWRPCELALAAENEFKYKGRVNYVDPKMSTETGTLRVRTEYENADEALLPGLFARVRFPMTSTKSMLVPEAALLSDQQGRYALVVGAEDKVEARRVKIGALDGTMRIVEEGLKPDDRVVVLGVLKARPGSKVTPKLQEEAAAGR